MLLDTIKLEKIITDALAEDIGEGDVTSNLTITNKATFEAKFITREEIVVSGIPVLEAIFERVGDFVKFIPNQKEGTIIKKGEVIFTVSGNARAILAHERVALNLLQHMCGISTITRKFVDEIKHTKAKLLDTRKTTPNLRILEKYAVWIGGGTNHRFCLDDAILIKDNHISIEGDIAETIRKAKAGAPDGMVIEVECDTIEQVKQAMAENPDIILLDNMNLETLREAVKYRNENHQNIKLEASGNVNLKTIKNIAETEVDFISVGMITNSAPSVDIGLDVG